MPPPKFWYNFNTAPSTGEPLLNLNLNFKWILRWFDVVFWCLEWECCTFKRLMKIHCVGPIFTKNIIWYMWKSYILVLSCTNIWSVEGKWQELNFVCLNLPNGELLTGLAFGRSSVRVGWCRRGVSGLPGVLALRSWTMVILPFYCFILYDLF